MEIYTTVIHKTMTQEDIKDWFFERYESEIPPEEWDILDIWNEICRLKLNNSIAAELALTCLIENDVI
jgi:hypothetical protein